MEGNGKKNCGRRDGRKAEIRFLFISFLCACFILTGSIALAGGCGCEGDEDVSGQADETLPVPDTFSVRHRKAARQMTRLVTKHLEAESIASMPVEVHPEKTVWVELSNTDLNRVVCSDGEITDVLFSQEKGIRVKTAGESAYIKFMMQQGETPDERPSTVKVPSEFYMVCGGETYSFIAKPRQVPSRTVYLVSEMASVRKGKDTFTSDPYDLALTRIIRTIFLDAVPSSWNREESFISGGRPFVLPVTGGVLTVQETASWHIPGAGVTARLFSVAATAVQGGSESVRIVERNFLFPDITTNPLAVSIEDNLLSSPSVTRAVIIEKSVDPVNPQGI